MHGPATRAVRRHWDAARRILDWARDYGDPDRDGYLEYRTRSSKGTKNQGWKDSGDAIVYDDGRPVPPPIATCEIQGYWHAAQQLMGVLCWLTGARGDARLAWNAADLKARFNRDWWMEGEEFIALAMDPDKALVRRPARTSATAWRPESSTAPTCPRSSGGCSRPTCSADGASGRSRPITAFTTR